MFIISAHVQTAAFVPAALVAPYYADNSGADKASIPFDFMQGWIPKFERVDIPRAKLPSKDVRFTSRIAFISVHLCGCNCSQAFKQIHGKLPSSTSFGLGTMSQFLTIDTAASTWATDLYIAVEVLTPLTPEFQLTYFNGFVRDILLIFRMPTLTSFSL